MRLCCVRLCLLLLSLCGPWLVQPFYFHVSSRNDRKIKHERFFHCCFKSRLEKRTNKKYYHTAKKCSSKQVKISYIRLRLRSPPIISLHKTKYKIFKLITRLVPYFYLPQIMFCLLLCFFWKKIISEQKAKKDQFFWNMWLSLVGL